ncbi:uncharacterized protein LOC116005099 [Ipomoea triloba]|uniref:uncharacterized protein LOC116005099 n=1 Tax=Ipomoea triloba TaxID=35885 RepID=UPI00125DDF92|nr:uncharacterized protein LOC116005099 [Ipomoea triloba]
MKFDDPFEVEEPISPYRDAITLDWDDETSPTRSSFDIEQLVKELTSKSMPMPSSFISHVESTISRGSDDDIIDPEIEKHFTAATSINLAFTNVAWSVLSLLTYLSLQLIQFTASTLRQIKILEYKIIEKTNEGYVGLANRDSELEDLKIKISVAEKELVELEKNVVSTLADYKSSSGYLDEAVQHPFILAPQIFKERNRAESFFKLILSTEIGRELVLKYGKWAYQTGQYNMQNRIILNLTRNLLHKYDLKRVLDILPEKIPDPGMAPAPFCETVSLEEISETETQESEIVRLNVDRTRTKLLILKNSVVWCLMLCARGCVYVCMYVCVCVGKGLGAGSSKKWG